MTTSESRGSSTVTSLRLCSRAPETISLEDDITPSRSLGGRTDVPLQDARIEQLFLEVGEERLGAQLLPRSPPEDLARIQAAAHAVHVLAEPLPNGGEVAPG